MIIKTAIVSVSLIVLSVASSVIASQTESFFYENIGYKLISNGKTQNKDYLLSISNSEAKKGKKYRDLTQMFYYSKKVENTCIVSDSSFSSTLFDEDIVLNTQSTFSIRDTEEPGGGYYLDDGLYYMYYSYYRNDLDLAEKINSGDFVLSRNEMLSARFDCDAPIYILDTLADQLIGSYQEKGFKIENKDYKTLITNHDYCILSLIKDDGKEYRFSINNIVYSDKRNVPSLIERNGLFGLVYENRALDDISFSYEMELKPQASLIRDVFETLTQLGYKNNSTVLNVYALENGANKTLDQKLSQVVGNSFDKVPLLNETIFYFFVIVSASGFIVLLLIDFLSKKEKRFIYALFSIAFILYSIISWFLYLSFMFLVLPTFFFIVCLIFGGKEIGIYAFKKIRKRMGFIKEEPADIYSIEI